MFPLKIVLISLLAVASFAHSAAIQMSLSLSKPSTFRNIVVLGASYGGAHAAQKLVESLPKDTGYRIILIERNSHMNHLYALPRFAVLPGHEYKAFIPYTHLLETQESNNHLLLHSTIVGFEANKVTLTHKFPALDTLHGEIFPDTKQNNTPTDWSNEVTFDYAIYALGAALPQSINLWGDDERMDVQDKPDPMILTMSNGTKPSSEAWLRRAQARIGKVKSVLVVGGGALGIQFASDIADIHKDKKVTLLHSRKQLLPSYDSRMHDEIYRTLRKLGVEVILGDRLDLSTIDPPEKDTKGQKIVKTQSGRILKADLILLCTGSAPNTQLIQAGLGNNVVNPMSRQVRVLRSLQVVDAPVVDNVREDLVENLTNGIEQVSLESYSPHTASSPQDTPFPHIFAIGDAADAFGAIAAGHTAYYQGEVAARNIVRLIQGKSQKELEAYVPGAPAIKVSLGLKHYVIQNGDLITTGDDGHDDLQTPTMWKLFGWKGDDIDMHQ